MNLFLCFYHDSLKNHEKVCIIKNYSYFCKPIYAKVAQLVEHNLAKVRVAGSSPVFRSRFFKICPGGGIGRHEGLKIL